MNVIAEITDDMFEIEPIPFNNPKVRYGKDTRWTYSCLFQKSKE